MPASWPAPRIRQVFVAEGGRHRARSGPPEGPEMRMGQPWDHCPRRWAVAVGSWSGVRPNPEVLLMALLTWLVSPSVGRAAPERALIVLEAGLSDDRTVVGA